MKLRLKNIRPAEESLARSLGGYIVLRVGPDVPGEGLPLFWRLEDPEFSLVEVALEPKTGCLRRVVIPLYRGDLFSRTDAIGEGARARSGMPCFDTEPWPESPGGPPKANYHTVQGRCECWMAGKDFCVSLFNEEIEYCIELCPGLKMCFNDSGQLCGLVAPNLSSDEMLRLSKEISRPLV